MTGSETPRPRRAPTIDADGVVGFTQALVQVPSVHDPARGLNEQPAAALVAERMRGFGWDPLIEEVAPGRPNVIAVLDSGIAGPTLLFEGHTDVVTEGDAASWTHDPFGGEIVDGRLYGRGAADMKGGLAAMVYAAAAVTRSGSFPGRIVLAALVDEEGMMTGAKHFVAAGHGRGVDAAIVCEPEGGEVCLAQKGALRLRVDARGRMAHGAMPDHGRNPLPALGQVMSLLERFERKLQQELGNHVHLGLPFLTPTVLLAGQDEQMNVIPADAHLAVDVRTVPGIDHADLVAGLRRGAREVSDRTGVTLDLTVVEDRPPTQLAAEEPVVGVLCAAHAAVVGEPPPFGGVPGTTDGTILWRDGRIPAVVYGPGGKWIAHQGNEFVLVDEIVQYARVYAEAALRFLRRAA